MHIRESTEVDIPAIVDLLRKSLGETSSPKSFDYWLWKHLHNPFGPSKVLLAESNGQLIGVRAMMQWKWQWEGQIYSALRAVDTATHPDFQGKGIFSVLTQKMVGHSSKNGINFIFNTPNKKSLPGYLKLGWVLLANLRVGFSFPASVIGKKNVYIKGAIHSENIALLCARWNLIQQKNNSLFTPKSFDYLKWRYLNNPVINYQVFADEDVFLAVYCRKRKHINELRIAEIICIDSSSDITKKVKMLISNYANELQANLITFAPGLKGFIPGIKLILPIGPKLAVKKINLDLSAFANFKTTYNLGDMELF